VTLPAESSVSGVIHQESLKDLLARLAAERAEADAAYNEALTALDRAVAAPPGLPAPPAPYDETRLPDINTHWDTAAAAGSDGLAAPLRRFLNRLLGPVFDRQRQFNAALVDHLNRNVNSTRETRQALAGALAGMRDHLDASHRFQAHLIRYLQTVTLYVDTRDRAVGGDARILNDGLSAISGDWLKRWESLRTREARLLGRTAEVAASIEDVRATASLAQQTALVLKRELERTLSGAAAAPAAPAKAAAAPVDLDAFKYLGFEDAFRGSQADIRQRLTEYVDLFAGAADVLDIGCGRGEFLELLNARGISNRGLDVNLAMVEESRSRGLSVEHGDALGYLEAQPDRSLGGVFAAQVVEHLQPDYLARLLEVAAHKIRPGGRIVLETINPACWLAFFESYIRDLTHVRPLHPETLQYLLRVSGFTDVTVAYKSPVAESTKLEPVPHPRGDVPDALVDLIDTFNSNVTRLNSRLFTYQDYAVIGRTPNAASGS